MLAPYWNVHCTAVQWTFHSLCIDLKSAQAVTQPWNWNCENPWRRTQASRAMRMVPFTSIAAVAQVASTQNP